MAAYSVIIPILLSAAVAFVAALVATPYFMRFMRNIGITGIDQQKRDKPLIPTSGGMPVVFAFFLGLMTFIALNTFVFGTHADLNLLLAAGLSTFSIALVGFFDDLYVRKTLVVNASAAQEYRVGLKQWQKPLLTLVAAIPLMAVYAGASSMTFPFVGVVQLGWAYPLLLIPLAVVCVSNATNMLAGLNGLEAALMIPPALVVAYWSYRFSNVEGAIIAALGAASLLAFLWFNWHPSRMLPGDSLTYFSGAMFVTAIILGNVEKLGLALFIPWIIEAFLKLRGRFKVRSYGDLQKDGSIKAPYTRIYSLTHVAMKIGQKMKPKWNERQLVLSLVALEFLVIAFAFAMVKVG